MFINSHNWYLKHGKFLALKNFAKKIGKYFGKQRFLAILPNLALSGNPENEWPLGV